MTVDNIISLVYVGVVLLVNVITMIAVIKKRKNGEVENAPITETTNQEIEIVKEELNNCLNNIKKTLEVECGLSFDLAVVKKEIKKVLK